MPEQIISNTHKSRTSATSSLSEVWKNFQIVTQPYWYPTKIGERAFSEVIEAWRMLALLILLIVSLVAVDGLGSFWNRYVVNLIIEDRELSKYLNTLWISCLLIVIVAFLVGFSKFVSKKLTFDWYKWLSHYFLRQYLSNQSYYKLHFQSNFHHPEHLLAEEIEPMTRDGILFLTTLLEKVLQMATFIIILWTISQQIAIYLIIYTIVSKLVGIYLNQKLEQIKQEEKDLKTDYKYALAGLRNHRESIAFSQGEKQEFESLERTFNQVFEKTEHRGNWERWQDIFNRAYQSAINIFSIFILIPLFIQDQINYGEITQASFCCFLFSNAVGILLSEGEKFGKLSSYIERLAKFSETLKSVFKQPQELTTINTVEDNRLAFENVTLRTPNYDKVIVENLSLSVQPGEGLLIVGASGRGKSSLLRAIAGLWTAGKGRVVRPCRTQMLFLSQYPYLPVGTLREQLLYPQTNRQISEQELEAILQQVNLQSLITRIDNFDVVMPWGDILSLGERQRLAFARILVSRPNFTILDRATNALDITNEENLYQQLKTIKTTFISISHRENLFNYHQWVLNLLENPNWQLLPIEEYKLQLGYASGFELSSSSNSGLINP